MSRTLKNLIKASGNSGAIGQSFRNHVTGAVTGAKMSDYNVDGWSFSAPPTNGSTYTGTQNFGGSITFTQGSRASNIKRTGAAMFDPTPTLSATEPTGGSVRVTTNSIVGAATGSSYNVQVKPGYNDVGSTPNGDPGWFDGYTSPSNPGGSSAANVTMFGFLGGVGAVTGSQTAAWTDLYVVDIGPYNSSLSVARSIFMNNRLEDTSDWDWEWHSNSSYTALLTATPTYTFSSLPDSAHTFYLRAARILNFSHIWQNIGAVTFTDPRQTVPATAPNTVVMHNPSSHVVTADWNNTNTVCQIHVSWERDTTGGGNWVEEATKDVAANSTVSGNRTVVNVGLNYRCRARYFNTAGNGPYSGYSTSIPVT
jgi:hypothetical protein